MKELGNLKFKKFTTPISEMAGAATEKGICFLAFESDWANKSIKNLKQEHTISDTQNQHLVLLEKELEQYFTGNRKGFSVPLDLQGTTFQKSVWQQLQTIPFGTTWSYEQQAKQLGDPKAIRAIAATNGKNPVSIIIPCHRVVGKNGKLTGYNAGVDKKEWLLDFEAKQVGIPTQAKLF